MITKEHQKGEIGYALGVAYRKQGFATEAARALMAYGFSALGLHRIQAITSNQKADSWGGDGTSRDETRGPIARG